VQVDVNAAANAAAPTVDAATSANVNANSDANTIPGAQINGVQAGVDAAARTNGQNINSDVLSNTKAGVDALQNRANASQNSNATTNANPFGATFDSNTTDRLIIQNLQPNSTASRLGLRTGDRIIGFNGQTYTDVNQFDRDLNQLNGNSDVPFIYERNGQRFTQPFRMSASNGQQTYGSSDNGNQGWSDQSGSIGQISYSANRPVYGMSSSSGYGSGSSYGSACCSVNRHHNHHNAYYQVGRRHRHHCR
jgi:C-terminal processing protease CtpA/Prc